MIRLWFLNLFLLASLGAADSPLAAELKLLFPQGRTVFQTNERIDLGVLRQDAAALPAAEMALTLSGTDGSKIALTFPVPAVPVVEGNAQATEHVQLNGWLLRPGSYTLDAAAHGATARAEIEVYSHVRKSTYKTVRWGVSKGQPRVLGPESLGFTLNYGDYAASLNPDYTANSIRSGLDGMPLMVLGGGHQQDLRLECDWSDPYVLRGDAGRVSRAALAARIAPNVIGIHLHDEPGLTWWHDPVTDKDVPHNIPAQDRAYRSAFGEDSIRWNEVKTDEPASVDRWFQRAKWKLSFIEAAWRLMYEATQRVQPDWLTVNQHMYGWYAYGDGYYFNVGRSLPVLNGHGGYDGGAGWYPAWYFEMGRARDLAKPAWYLPTFDGNLSPVQARTEHYQTFMLHGEGVMVPFWQDYPSQISSAEGIAESNQTLQRLGPIFDGMPFTRPAAAVLYSISQCLHAQTKDMTDGYDGGEHKRRLYFAYVAGKLNQTPLQPVYEEDILDGTLAAHHRAVVLPGIQFLDPKVVVELEAFSAAGGAVLLSDDCTVSIQGAKKIGPIDTSPWDDQQRLWRAGDQEGAMDALAMENIIKATLPLAQRLRKELGALGISPVFECDNPGIWASRQAAGDVEYVFAVNGTHDPAAGREVIRPATATIALPGDGRPVYDAVRTGSVAEFKLAPGGKILTGKFRFGPGQLRVFARTPRPIQGVQVLTPKIVRDYTVAESPVRLDFRAVVLDNTGQALAGAFPLRVRVIDPLGVTRFDLYRATRDGALDLSLPLAANDASGHWQIVATDLLAGTEDATPFTYAAPASCGALGGAGRRALLFGRDREAIYDYFRRFKEVTIVNGSSDYLEPAAQRITEMLRPWGVRCAVVRADEVNHAREVTEDEAVTMVGLHSAARGEIKAGKGNNPKLVGYDVCGPVILLGSPADNPLLQTVEEIGSLPYRISEQFPGRGNGLLVWGRDGIGIGQEHVAVIGFDAAGVGQAAGTLYEVVAGIESLMPWQPPTSAPVTVAAWPNLPAPAQVVWQVLLPDGVITLRVVPNGAVAVLTKDASVSLLDAKGKLLWQQAVPPAPTLAMDASADGRLIAVGAGQRLLAFTNQGKKLFDTGFAQDQPVTAVAVSSDGTQIAAGSRHSLLALYTAKGQRQWLIGGETLAAHVQAVQQWQADLEQWEQAPAGADGKKSARPNKPGLPNPDPCLALAFSADGSRLVALTVGAGRVVNAADGAVAGWLGGVAGRFGLTRAGDDFLAVDGKRAVSLISPAEAKTVKQLTLPAEGAVAAAAWGNRVVAGTEVDESIHCLNDLDGEVEAQTAWKHSRPCRAVKRVIASGNHVAVAYWGGTLEILDVKGGVEFSQMLPQDIADLAWSSDRLMVGLADGRLLLIEAGQKK